jgi:hypothetical protein
MPFHILVPLLFTAIAISYGLRRLFHSRFLSDYLFIVAVNIAAIRYALVAPFLSFPPTLYSSTLLFFFYQFCSSTLLYLQTLLLSVLTASF